MSFFLFKSKINDFHFLRNARLITHLFERQSSRAIPMISHNLLRFPTTFIQVNVHSEKHRAVPSLGPQGDGGEPESA